jgi:outer membrane receptor protein involved in Fe transport
MAELFRGKFPGVEVFEAPGGGIRVKIRNSGALNGDLSSRNSDVGDPIYVVDNVEVSAPDGVLFMDPNTIAKIEVERVSALYGIRGSNGVIKITTKH